jgi:hypothetical protein
MLEHLLDEGMESMSAESMIPGALGLSSVDGSSCCGAQGQILQITLRICIKKISMMKLS